MRRILSGQAVAAPTESAKLVAGTSGVHVEFPLSGGWLRRQIDRMRAPATPVAHVYLWDVYFAAGADDDGNVLAQLKIVNTSRRAAVVDCFSHFCILVGGNDVGASAPTYEPPPPIAPGFVAPIRLFYRFGAPGVRVLLRATHRAPNLQSSPRLEVILRGALDVRVGKKRERVDVNVSTVAPRLNLTCPAAGDHP